MNLNARQRNRIRKITRSAYGTCGGRCDASIELAATGVLAIINTILNPVLIGEAMTLMVELILYWTGRQDLEPPAVYVTGEPGVDIDD